MEFEGFEVDSNDFYFAYDLDMESKTCTRLYHFHDGIMERLLHGEWVDACEQWCIFVGEDIFYDEVPEDVALTLTVRWQEVEGMSDLSWQEYVDNFDNWSESTRRSYVSRLKSFGEHQDVAWIASYLYDEAAGSNGNIMIQIKQEISRYFIIYEAQNPHIFTILYVPWV